MRSRKQTRRIAIIIVLLVLLALLGIGFANYLATRRLGIDLTLTPKTTLDVPQYMFSFGGPESDLMRRPIGVLVVDDKVYVSDGRRSVVDVFQLNGQRTSQMGKGVLVTPLYMARHPKTGDIYVTDRRTRSVRVFNSQGKYLREFKPNLPKSELAKFDTQGFVWAPIGIDFAPDGTLYVTEILNGHRLLIFGPDGKFKKSVGTAGFAPDASEAPLLFQFPNSIKVRGKEVWIADSNNRRIQVLDREGEFVRFVPTAGLPRGFDFLRKFRSDDASAPGRLAVVDTLSHDVTVWSQSGEKVLSFGGIGVLEGEFSYPGDLSVSNDNKIYVTDTNNSRVQVWGWPAENAPFRPPTTPLGWLLCLSPLLLLPLLLLLRRKNFLATPDFVAAIVELDRLDAMPARRRRWVVFETDVEAVRQLVPDAMAQELGLEFEPWPTSDADAKQLMERLDLPYDVAARLAIAQRVKVFCTEDAELKRLAKVLEIDGVDSREFMERYAKELAQKEAR